MICDFKDASKIVLNWLNLTLFDKSYEIALELKCLATGAANSSEINDKSKRWEIIWINVIIIIIIIMNRKLFVLHIIISSLKCFESSAWFPQYCVLKKYDTCYSWFVCCYETWIPSEEYTPRLFTEITKQDIPFSERLRKM
jgi:hypothetical protein